MDCGFNNNGGLFIANNKERLDEYKRLQSVGYFIITKTFQTCLGIIYKLFKSFSYFIILIPLQLGKYFGIETHVLGPEETKNLYPLMNVRDVYGTLYSPEDGCLDPSTYVSALSRAATMLGGEIHCDTSVTGFPSLIEILSELFGCFILKSKYHVVTTWLPRHHLPGIETDVTKGRKRVTGVQTNRGFIKTQKVVNCTGAWGPYLSQMVGVDCPLVPFRHAYVVTEDIPGKRGSSAKLLSHVNIAPLQSYYHMLYRS